MTQSMQERAAIAFICRARSHDGELYDKLCTQIRVLVSEHNKFVDNRAHLIKTGRALCERTRALSIRPADTQVLLRENEQMRLSLETLSSTAKPSARSPEELSESELIVLHSITVMVLTRVLMLPGKA